MSDKPIREVRRLAVIQHHIDPRRDDKEARKVWAETCEKAYAAIRANVPVTELEGVNPIEPYGRFSGVFEWRTYWHSSDGLETVYVVIREYEVDPTPEESAVIDLDEVVRLLREVHDIDNAYVAQTGGGVATIYAGPTRPDPDIQSVAWGDVRYAAIAGPGTYGWGVKPSTASLDDFFVGVDDQGEADPVAPGEVGARTEADVAKLIAAQAWKSDPTQPLSADEIAALGFDGPRS